MTSRSKFLPTLCLLLVTFAGPPSQEEDAASAQRPPRSAQRFLPAALFSTQEVLAHTGELGLSPGQRKRIEAFVAAHEAELASLRPAQAAEAARFAGLIAPAEVDEAAALASIDAALEIERMDRRARLVHLVRLKNLLTSEQQAALGRLRERRLPTSEPSTRCGTCGRGGPRR